MENLIHYIKGELLSVYDGAEAAAVAREVAETCFGVSLIQAYSGTARQLSPDEKLRLRDILVRLRNQEPLQYVLGEARFMGHVFRVAPGVLIPRPETEELVSCVLREDSGRAPVVVDAGTGSGCIAVSVKLALPEAQVVGVDVSEEALRQARANADRLGADVRFFCADLLRPDSLPRLRADVLVSNPPYVRLSERDGMERRVKDFEPSEALFVPDGDALKFYAALAEWGRVALNPGGRILVEINSALGKETVSLFRSRGYRDTTLLKDRFGKDRIVICSI